MSKQKHTPGPWGIHKLRPTMVYPSHLVFDQRGFLVAEGRAAGGPLRQATANAKLIATAPELLAALEATLAYLPHAASGASDVIHPVLSRARAALAKAKGHQ